MVEKFSLWIGSVQRAKMAPVHGGLQEQRNSKRNVHQVAGREEDCSKEQR